MNKYIILIVFVVLIIGLFVFKKEAKSDNSSPKELELTYEMNAGIPFKRIYEIEDPTIVEFVKSYVVRDDNQGGIVGASVYTNYVFKGLKEGTTTITFKVVSIDDETDIMSEDVNNVKVDKDGNISLIK